jgi:uncharacterized membrane protein
MRNEVRRSGATTPSVGDRNTGRFIAPTSLLDEVNERKKHAHSPSGVHRLTTPAEFNTAMIHFYRGEVQRSNTWRNRLDTTTNWAVLTAGATLSFAFSSSNNPHFVIPINSLLVAIFLLMEARRYRYYEIWSSRVRVLETGYFAQRKCSGRFGVGRASCERSIDTAFYNQRMGSDRQAPPQKLSLDLCVACA